MFWPKYSKLLAWTSFAKFQNGNMCSLALNFYVWSFFWFCLQYTFLMACESWWVCGREIKCQTNFVFILLFLCSDDGDFCVFFLNFCVSTKMVLVGERVVCVRRTVEWNALAAASFQIIQQIRPIFTRTWKKFRTLFTWPWLWKVLAFNAMSFSSFHLFFPIFPLVSVYLLNH